jgi:hypothetical protein
VRPARKRESFIATITAAAVVVIGLLAGINASAGPALASVANSSVPANYGALPASWHGYAPPAAQAASAAVCSNAEAIFNQNSGKVLEVYDSSTANGGTVDQWAYNGTQTQHWCFITVATLGGGVPVYEIINNNSGKCLDMPNDNLADGQHLQQWTCNGNEQQEWAWFNEDTYDLIAPATDANSIYGYLYMMEVYDSSTANGAEVDVWTGNNTATQHWCPGEACS